MSTDYITFADFMNVEILLGEIIAVDVVPDADKLLRLEVAVGEEQPRQIISGIREYFTDPQELVGVKCPFVLNIEPRTIRGLESQGMILAADHNDTFAFFTPSADLPAGTRLH